MLRRAHAEEVEFITIMTFESLEAIKQFIGEDVSVSNVPAKAQAVLSRWDDGSQHYEVQEHLSY